MKIMNGNRGAMIERLLLTRREAAEIMGICERTLDSMSQRGQLPVVRIGRAVRYDLGDLQAWIRAKKSSEIA